MSLAKGRIAGLMRVYGLDACTGKDNYPPEWHEHVKHAVREAADHRCIRCLHPYKKGDGKWSRCDERCTHGGPVRLSLPESYPNWQPTVHDELKAGVTVHDLLTGHPQMVCEAHHRILTVHHLDGVKGNLRWWNLVALCQRCHLTIQGRVKMERTWPWPHSEWFRPYVAGYYAWTYLGEEITREEAEARMDELLALEQQVA